VASIQAAVLPQGPRAHRQLFLTHVPQPWGTCVQAGHDGGRKERTPHSLAPRDDYHGVLIPVAATVLLAGQILFLVPSSLDRKRGGGAGGILTMMTKLVGKEQGTTSATSQTTIRHWTTSSSCRKNALWR
jgi:hypothetical protein